MHGRRQNNWEVVSHCVLVITRRLDRRGIDPKPCFRIPVSIVRLDAFRAEAARQFSSAELGREGPDAINVDLLIFALAWGRRSRRGSSVAYVIAGRSIVLNAKALAFAYEGRLVFAKRASPHAVTIPERSYLRASLAEFAPALADSLRKVASGLCA